jgi:MFS family permease
MTSIATLVWQPFSAYLIVRVNPRILMTVNVFCWGTSAACMAAANGNASLLVTRFLLGLFEAANIPLCKSAENSAECSCKYRLTYSLNVDRELVPTS